MISIYCRLLLLSERLETWIYCIVFILIPLGSDSKDNENGRVTSHHSLKDTSSKRTKLTDNLEHVIGTVLNPLPMRTLYSSLFILKDTCILRPSILNSGDLTLIFLETGIVFRPQTGYLRLPLCWLLIYVINVIINFTVNVFDIPIKSSTETTVSFVCFRTYLVCWPLCPRVQLSLLLTTLTL